MNPDFQRLHPLTIIVEAWRAVSRFIIVIAFLGFNIVTGQGVGDTTELIFAGLGFLVVGSALVRYYTFSFAVHQGSLLVKQGLVTKQARTIPLARIQNINLKRDLIHRVLGLVDLEIETAGGAKAEAVLSAVTEDQAHELKQRLLGRYEATSSALIEARREEVIYQASPRELFLAGATENRLLIMVASVFGIVATLPGFMDSISKFVEAAVKGAAQTAGRSPNDWVLWGILGFLAIAFGWVASIVTTFVSYWGFEVAWRDGSFRRHYGLLNQFENVVPARRIQSARMTDNIFQRMLKVSKLYLDTAGGFSQANGNEGQQSARPTPLMAPLIDAEGAQKILVRVFPTYLPTDEGWTMPPVQMIWRSLYSTFVPALIISAPVAWFFQYWAIAAFFGVFALSALSAWIERPGTGWRDDGERILVRKGRIWRTLHIAPIQKLQMAEYSQTPAQRRFGLATIKFSTASMSGGSSLIVADIPADEARNLVWDLHRRSGLDAWKNPDGF